MAHDPTNFEIDVDLAPILGGNEPLLVSARWYKLLHARAERPASLQTKIDAAFKNAVLSLQWRAATQRAPERRRAIRVPLLSRVHLAHGRPMVSCDVSLSGLRCSGRPAGGLLDIEFKLPNLPFPVAARAEVVSFADRKIIPLVGMRFVDIEPVYLDHINSYIDARRAQLCAA